jgi:hypothetical protein
MVQPSSGLETDSSDEISLPVFNNMRSILENLPFYMGTKSILENVSRASEELVQKFTQ